MCPADTDPRVWEVWMEQQRAMEPGDPLRQIFDATGFVIALQEAGVRLQFPNASPYDVKLHAAARRYGPDLIRRAYGWDPDSNEQPG